MSQRNDKGTALALTKRTMFPLRHYRTIAFQWGEREQAVKINTKQNSECRMTVCGAKLKELLRTQVSLIIVHKIKRVLHVLKIG